jgi:acetate kinase
MLIDMNILVLNCGSSSIKYQLLNIEEGTNVLAKGQVDRIGIEGSCLEHKAPGMEDYEITTVIEDHRTGINLLLKVLIDSEVGVLQSISDINAVGHRVAHGGEMFTESKLIDDEVKEGIKNCFELAPLHNPANYCGIEAMEELLPDVPQVAVFDTAFHQTMPKHSYLYPLPYEYYKKLNVRRYGFHGTSHKYVAEKACKLLNCDFKSKKIITCHLGNGASITAIDRGESVDTSMGFTPNEGLMMGTRSGSVDPGALLYIAKKEGVSSDELNDILNKESGVKGISQISSDMRDLANEARSGNERAQLALKMYAHRVKKYIGAFIAVLNGLDILILTGGIGENNDYVREMCCSDLEFLGISFDSKKNIGLRGKDEEISLPGSKVKVMILTTNEELVIAQETFKLVNIGK